MTKTLMLHRVLPQLQAGGYYLRRGTAIDAACFHRLLDALEHSGARTVTPLDVDDDDDDDDGDGQRCRVCITFDDGYADIAPALDALLARGMCATIFAVKEYCVNNFSPIDDAAAWLDATTDAPPQLIASLTDGAMKKRMRNLSSRRYRRLRERLFGLGDHPDAAQFLTERQLRDYHARGVAIGIHGCTHRVWSNLSAPQLRAEIEQAANWLRGIGVRDIAGLCFPHGRHRTLCDLGPAVARLAAVGVFGVDAPYADPAVTRRIWIRPNTERDFAALFGKR